MVADALISADANLQSTEVVRDTISLQTFVDQPVSSWPNSLLWSGDSLDFLTHLPEKPIFDLIVSSPPYNLNKPYERGKALIEYQIQQEEVIEQLVLRLKPSGSLCWQVGNYVNPAIPSGQRTSIYPLDFLFHPMFERRGLLLRNRIIWRFGHGLHCKHRFSGRYETVLWYTRGDKYKFNLDPVRIPSKYPGKRFYKGPKVGQFSGNPLGKNPEDVWDDVWNIPNVKSNHAEKTKHPCQFPVGLIERLVLALTEPGDLVFDPYAGVASSGVASIIHARRFWGCENVSEYVELGRKRLDEAVVGNAKYRPHDREIYDHMQSPLAHRT